MIWFLITTFLVGANGYLWYRIGIRQEQGKIEKAQAEAEERSYQRSRRTGSVKLNTIRIRR